MSDLDADLLALLGPGAASPAPAQSESQESAAAAPELDLAALLEPAQAVPEAVPDTDPVHSATEPEHIARLAEIVARRMELEAELHDLFLQLDSAQVLLKLGLWAPEHASIAVALRRRIDKKGMDWNWTETQAWRVAYDAGLIPPWPRPKDWTPFNLLEGRHP